MCKGAASLGSGRSGRNGHQKDWWGEKRWEEGSSISDWGRSFCVQGRSDGFYDACSSIDDYLLVFYVDDPSSRIESPAAS